MDSLGEELDVESVQKLNKELEAIFSPNAERTSSDRQKFARRIQLTLSGIARQDLNLICQVKMFGSFLNGFQTGGSDLDLVLDPQEEGEKLMEKERMADLLEKVAKVLHKYGFDNTT